MSRWLPSRSQGRAVPILGIDRQHLAWQGCAGTADGSALVGDRRADSLSRWAQGLRGRGSRFVDVVAGNDLAVYWLQQPPATTASLDELRQVARARCAQLHGGVSDDWCVAGDWHARRPFVCAALPRQEMGAFTSELQSLGLQPRWHTALGLIGLHGAARFPDEGWCALRSPRRVMLWHVTKGWIDGITGLMVEPDEEADQVRRRAAQQIRLECARAGYGQDELLDWVDDRAQQPCEAACAAMLGARHIGTSA